MYCYIKTHQINEFLHKACILCHFEFEQKNILQIPVVSEEFLYESIINKKLQDPDNYYPSA